VATYNARNLLVYQGRTLNSVVAEEAEERAEAEMGTRAEVERVVELLVAAATAAEKLEACWAVAKAATLVAMAAAWPAAD
jgi:hypothetical protein